MHNTIIAQSGAVVNIFDAKIAPKRPKTARKSIKIDEKRQTIKTYDRLARARVKRAERAADEVKPMYQRWDEHKALAVQVGERMISAGLIKRGWRVKMCNQELDIIRCADCGHITIRGASLCRDRLCPLCAWRLAIKRYAAMQTILSVLMSRVKRASYALVTLTVKNCAPDALSDTLKAMSKAWNAVTYQRWARKWLWGWAKSIEVTYNSETGELHPHYHVLMVCDSGKPLSQELIAEWLDRVRREGLTATAAAQHADDVISSAVSDPGKSLIGAVCEVYKYMVKASDTLSMPLGVLHAFAVGIADKRLISMGGMIKAIAKELKQEQLDAADADMSDTEVCTECKSQHLDRLTALWSMSGMHYYTAQGKSMVEELASYKEDN